MRIRFQADADLNHALVAGTLRRSASLDFRRAEEVLAGLGDPNVLALAAESGRVLVSHDVHTPATANERRSRNRRVDSALGGA